MPSLRDRLAAALAPEFRVEDRVGQGGMGAVFRAYDNNLRRWVAIKVLLPHLATEVAARRFLREARTLANLSHPHIVPVHQVGESRGLFYFVMDFVDGEKLAERLERGPLSRVDGIKLGRDLLDALEAVHEQGRVHCDIKPANIFLTDRRMLLADFGIATPSTKANETLTVRDFQPHTPEYATPEQAEHREVTPQTDLYAAATVLYESFTGRKWHAQGATYDPGLADWRGVPRRQRRALTRALAPDPSQRWGDAREFRMAFDERVIVFASPVFAAIVAAAVASVIVVAIGPRFVNGFGTEDVVLVTTSAALAPDVASIADSAADYLLDRLSLSGDFRACVPSDRCGEPRTTLVVSAEVEGSQLKLATRSPEQDAIFASGSVDSISHWRSAARNMLTNVLFQLWEDSPVYRDLRRTLPADPDAMRAFIDGEQLWHEARWKEARSKYEQAVEIDLSCYLCSWRITDVQRWLQQDPDSVHLSRVLANTSLFPDRYRLLIQARVSPLDERLEILEAITETDNAFFLAHFAFGEELLHRGALTGRSLEEAAIELRKAADSRPNFAPAIQHVLWANLLLREIPAAAAAWARLDSVPSSEDLEAQMNRLVLGVALAFQTGQAHDVLAGIVGDASTLAADARFAAGARFMMGHGTPRGALELGALYHTTLGGLGMGFDGLFGRFVGAFAMGRLQFAREIAARVHQESPSKTEFQAFVTQLEAATLIVDSTQHDTSRIVEALSGMSGSAFEEEVRQPVAFMHTLLQRKSGRRSELESLVKDERLRTLLAAHALAMGGEFEDALARTDSLVQREMTVAAGKALTIANSLTDGGMVVSSPSTDLGDFAVPIYRSMLYLLRAEWLVATNDLRGGIASLRWHENTDVPELPTGDPMPYEADWALGTLASWNRANLLDEVNEGAPDRELCRLYRNVSNLWADGDPPYARRAEKAGLRWNEIGCASLSGVTG